MKNVWLIVLSLKEYPGLQRSRGIINFNRGKHPGAPIALASMGALFEKKMVYFLSMNEPMMATMPAMMANAPMI
jgi:hypothetical protein